jgi:outer membrane receptor for ferrienterochelin and colicin
MTKRNLLLAVSVLALGCASSGSTATADDQGQSRTSNVITREEIAATSMGNMADVIQQLRPQFLRTRGRTSINLPADQVAVYMDDVHVGTTSALRTISANTVLRVEFIRGPDTGFKFGLDHQAGVIHVITK